MNYFTDWQHERRMTPDQYRRALKILGLNISSAGRFLGVSYSTSFRYAHGSADVPTAVALLLNGLVELAIKPVVPSTQRSIKP